MIALGCYLRTTDLRAALLAGPAPAERGREVIYIVPSHANDSPLADLLRTSGSFFGERPKIWSWSELYRALVPRALVRRQVDPPDHRMILMHVIDGAIAEMESSGERPPVGVAGAGFVDVLSSAIRELMLEDISPDKLLDGGAESELLHRLYSDHLYYLEQNGLADNSMLPTLARDDMDVDEARALLSRSSLRWVGFLSFTGAQRKLIRRLESIAPHDCVMRFFVPDCGLPSFTDAAVQLDKRMIGEPSGGGGVRALRVTGRNSLDQYDAVARAAAQMMADGAGHDIGIQTAPGCAGLMASALRRYGIASQLCVETPVRDTVVMSVPLAAWEARLDGWQTMQTFALLSSPVFGSDAPDRGKVFAHMPEGADAWRELLGDTPAGENFARLCGFCDFIDCDDGHTAEELIGALLELASPEWCERLADEAGDDAETDDAVRLASSARVEAEHKLKLLREMTKPIGPAGERRFRGAAAMSFMLGWAAEAKTALPLPLADAVSIYDSPPPVLVSHDLWIMTDVDASRWPGAASDHVLLGGELRERINDDDCHLPTLREKREQKHAMFRRLLCAGESTTLIASAQLDEEGRSRSASPFIAALTAPWTTDDLTPPDPPTARRRDRGSFPRAAEYHSPDGERLCVGASSLDEWKSCPYRFLMTRVLKIDDPDPMPTPFSPRERGLVAHSVWQRSWNARSARGITIRAAVEETWDAALAEQADKHPFVIDDRAAQSRASLRRLIASLADAQDDAERRAEAAGFVRSRTLVEYELPHKEMHNVTFVGRADRIDLWDGVGAVIVDYKSGRAKANENSLQLACYAHMLGSSLGADVVGFCWLGLRDSRTFGYYALPKLREIYEGTPSKDGDADAFDALMLEAAGAMSGIDDAAGGGLFESSHDSKACRSCRCSELCRRGEKMGERTTEDDGDDE